ncbi:hypothetical protein QUC31_020342 [Theobroma cacao]
MSPEDLEIANQSKVTALTIAAAIGNTDAAKLLVSINPNLPHIQDGDEGFPVHRAAQSGHKETLVYLLKVTRDDVQPSPFENNSGVWLLRQIIFVGFYVRSSAFRSSSELTLCQRFLYSCVPPMKLENVPNNSIRGDIENPANNSQAPIWSSFQHFRGGNFLSPVCGAVRQKLHRALWDLIDSLVPQVKHIRQMKFMHGEALRLVKLLCTEAERLDPQKAANIFADPLFQAVSHGIPEIIENILVSFPIAVQFRDNDGRNIIERAVLYRRHNVFNLIYRMNHAQRIRHLSQYIPLNKAALKGDRESARRIFDSNPNAIAAGIMEGLSTALHIAVGTGKNIDFVRNLIDLKPVEALELTNDSNSTSLTVAAMVGNLEVARLLVERNPNLPYIRDNNEVVPLHRAVQYGHKNLVSFLLGVTRNEIEPTYPSPYADESGLMLQLLLVLVGFMVCVPINMENLPNHPIEGDYPADCSQVCVQICSRFSTARGNHLMFGWQKLPAMAWEVIEILVGFFRSYRVTQAAAPFACKLWNSRSYRRDLRVNAPCTINCDPEKRDAIRGAVVHHHENVFNLLCNMSGHMHYVVQSTDIFANNNLQLAGKLAPPERVSLVSGAALQMQRELQWILEKFVKPGFRNALNGERKTPAMVFTEEHKELLKEGEQWLKDTANSCTVVAALIATVVFAALSLYQEAITGIMASQYSLLPLLVDMFHSTYGPSILGRQNKLPFKLP